MGTNPELTVTGLDVDFLNPSAEMLIRFGFFSVVFLVMAAWEMMAPRRELTVPKAARWLNNLGLVAINVITLRLIFPAAAIGMALLSQEQGWGMFNYFGTPFWPAFLLTIVAMDLAIYLQHVMVHAVPALWRLHRVHHADLDYDVTTGSRFHPIEMVLSMMLKLALVALLGAPPSTVLVFEVLLNATAMFNHSNVRMPRALDRVLRWFVVTPDMHRVHHSVEQDEANSNFGFNLPWWDRLFATYRGQPRNGHEGMTIGIRSIRDPRQCERIAGMLAIPFRGKPTSYVINRRADVTTPPPAV